MASGSKDKKDKAPVKRSNTEVKKKTTKIASVGQKRPAAKPIAKAAPIKGSGAKGQATKKPKRK